MPRQVPQRPDTVLGKILLQLFGDGEIGIEHVQRLLREVARKALKETFGRLKSD
jgi:hypothetical protein